MIDNNAKAGYMASSNTHEQNIALFGGMTREEMWGFRDTVQGALIGESTSRFIIRDATQAADRITMLWIHAHQRTDQHER